MIALIPGSFDPITCGHVNVIERTARIFDKVYVAVMNNDSAKYDARLSSKTYMLDKSERLEAVKLAVAHIQRAEPIAYGGMLIDLFDELGADVIVRGIRTELDLEYELIHAKWNRQHNSRAETLFLPAADGLASVSSTYVRELIEENRFDELDGIVPEKVIKYLKTKNHS